MAELRSRRLQVAVAASAWWLIAQGLINCLASQRLGDLLHLRYLDIMVPYIRQCGVMQLSFGLFVLTGLRAARTQVLAVDLLILAFLAQVFFNLNYRLGRNELNTFEWLSIAVNMSLGSLLTAFRTRSSEMAPSSAGNLVALSVKELAVQIKTAAKDPKSIRLSLGPLQPEAKGEGKEGGDRRSEALPHID